MEDVLSQLQEFENNLRASLRRHSILSNSVASIGDSFSEGKSNVSILREQISESASRRTEKNLNGVYLNYAKDPKGVCQCDFFDACRAVRFDFTSRIETDELFISMDMNDDGFLDWDEFRRALNVLSPLVSCKQFLFMKLFQLLFLVSRESLPWMSSRT